MAFNIVESVLYTNSQQAVTLTEEQIEKACALVIRVIKTTLPDEAHSVEVFDYILGRVKDEVRSMPINLQ